MSIFLRTDTLTEKKIICSRLSMSYSNNRTFELWRSFMPGRKEIKNIVSDDLYSIQIYGRAFDFKNFSPEMEFDKLAGIEVSDFSSIPEGMEAFVLESGLYAVFLHRGTGADAPATFRYIFGDWLGRSDYKIDFRPHFEILGKKYRRNDPLSEEEVWIPVRLRSSA